MRTNGAEESEESSDSSDEEDEERKAPNELIMEFLQCVMANDIENSLKLCKMSTLDAICMNSLIINYNAVRRNI